MSKKLISLAVATIVALGAIAATSDSYADGRGGGWRGGGHGWNGGGRGWRGGGRGYYRGGGWGNGVGVGIAAGVLGGVAAGLAGGYYGGGYYGVPPPLGYRYYGSYPYPYQPYCLGYCPY